MTEQNNTRQNLEPYTLALLAAVAVLYTGDIYRSIFTGLLVAALIYGYQSEKIFALYGWLERGFKLLVSRFRTKKAPDSIEINLYDIVLGRSVETGEIVVGNLKQLKSMAVWAINGAGKTTFLHSLIHFIIEHYDPEEIQLMISDLKDGLDFGIYRRLPHLFCPIAETTGDTHRMIEVLKQEKDRRSQLFKRLAQGDKLRLCNDLERYHQLLDEHNLDWQRLPRIVVIFDEISVFTRNAQTLNELIHIAETGRAYGIHLVCSTQFPKVESIPRLLKEQLNTRFVGQMASKAAYYQVADIYKEVYEGVNLKRGQFFASLGGSEYRVIQGRYIPDRQLENMANEVSNGHTEPEWQIEAITLQEEVKHDWNGTDEDKRLALLSWFDGFDEMPTPDDFVRDFKATKRTYYNWVPQLWGEFA